MWRYGEPEPCPFSTRKKLISCHLGPGSIRRGSRESQGLVLLRIRITRQEIFYAHVGPGSWSYSFSRGSFLARRITSNAPMHDSPPHGHTHAYYSSQGNKTTSTPYRVTKLVCIVVRLHARPVVTSPPSPPHLTAVNYRPPRGKNEAILI